MTVRYANPTQPNPTQQNQSYTKTIEINGRTHIVTVLPPASDESPLLITARANRSAIQLAMRQQQDEREAWFLSDTQSFRLRMC